MAYPFQPPISGQIRESQSLQKGNPESEQARLALNGKSRHKRSGRQSAFFDLVCRVIRPVMLLVEDCSPHTCKLHWAAIRSNRGPIRKLWIRSGTGTKSEGQVRSVTTATDGGHWSSAARQRTGCMECARSCRSRWPQRAVSGDRCPSNEHLKRA